MRISLVIPAYNEEAQIGACLDSVLEHAKAGLYEIIVVDNASTDRTADVARARIGVRVVSEREKGLTKARERGRLEARGDLVAMIDADTRVRPGWVEMIHATFEANPRVVSLSGPARYFDGTPLQSGVMRALWGLSAPLAYHATGYLLYGANFVVRADALKAIGGFDRSIEFYGEDTDLARRLSARGKVVFKSDFWIWGSARRFREEGLWRTNGRYMLNMLWPALFGQPFTRTHHDIRV